MGRLFLLLISVLWIGGCLWFSGSALFSVGKDIDELKRAGSSVSWPTTDAVITDSDIESYVHKSETTFRPAIKYEYRVNGQTYSSDVISSGTELEQYGNQDFAQLVVNAYSVGSHHKAHFLKSDPETVYLVPGIDPENYHLNALSQAFGGVLGIILFVAIVARLKFMPRTRGFKAGLAAMPLRMAFGLVIAGAFIGSFMIEHAVEQDIIKKNVPDTAKVHLTDRGSFCAHIRENTTRNDPRKAKQGPIVTAFAGLCNIPTGSIGFYFTGSISHV